MSSIVIKCEVRGKLRVDKHEQKSVICGNSNARNKILEHDCGHHHFQIPSMRVRPSHRTHWWLLRKLCPQLCFKVTFVYLRHNAAIQGEVGCWIQPVEPHTKWVCWRVCWVQKPYLSLHQTSKWTKIPYGNNMNQILPQYSPFLSNWMHSLFLFF